VRGSRRAAVAAGLVILLGVPRAQAFPFLDDPAVVYGLGIVNELLQAIERVELTIHLALETGVKGIVRDLGFPGDLFGELRQTLSQVKGIRDELAALSCGWRFSSRTASLRDLYFSPRLVCRRGFQAVWGASSFGPDRDLEEFRDYVGALSTNMISGRVDAAEAWREQFPAIEQGSALVRQSPGEANRDEAVALAGAGRIADSNSALATESLLLEEVEASAERENARRGLDLGRFVLLGTAGVDPWTADRP
jgi:hypothetical protein